MTTEQNWIFTLAYVLCSAIAGAKQYSSDYRDRDSMAFYTTLAFIFGPMWLLIAIIRQTFVETWQ